MRETRRTTEESLLPPPRDRRPVADEPRGDEHGRGRQGKDAPDGTRPDGTEGRGYRLGDEQPLGGGTMQFAIWLLGLMCHLSALVRDTLQHRLHPRQGKGSHSSVGSFHVFVFSTVKCFRRGQTADVASSLLQRASSSSCHRTRSSRRCGSMTSASLSPASRTTGAGGGASASSTCWTPRDGSTTRSTLSASASTST